MKWKIELQPDGKVNLVFLKDGKSYYIYSRSNPTESGKKFYRAFYRGEGAYIILGLGYFYHILPFLQDKNVERLIVLEPDEGLVSLIKDSDMFKKLEQNEKVSLIIGLPEINWFIEGLKGNYHLLFHSGINLLSYPAIERLFPELYGNLKRKINFSLSELFNDGLTIARFAKRWVLNLKNNLKYLSECYDITNLRDTIKGSCIVAAAGPSLEKAIENLKMRNKKDYFIIAVDAAVRPLVLSGIVPDLIISIDPQPYIRFHFFGIENKIKNIAAILNPMTHYEVFKLFDEKYIYFTKHPLLRVFKGIEAMPIEDFNFKSVSSLAVKIAKFLGFKRIYLIGFDYFYTNYKSYAKGSFLYRYVLANISRLNQFLTSEVEFISKRLKKKGDKLIPEGLNNYKKELEGLIEKLKSIDSDVEFYNLFSQGARINGAERSDTKNFRTLKIDHNFTGKSLNSKIKMNSNLLFNLLENDTKKSIVNSLALHYKLIKGLKTDMAFEKSEGIFKNSILFEFKNEIKSVT